MVSYIWPEIWWMMPASLCTLLSHSQPQNQPQNLHASLRQRVMQRQEEEACPRVPDVLQLDKKGHPSNLCLCTTVSASRPLRIVCTCIMQVVASNTFV